MTEKSVTVRTPGVGFTGLLTLVFIVLKLTGVISWSWLWVLSPIWISLGLFLLVAIPFLILVAVVESKKTPLQRQVEELQKKHGGRR